MPCDQTPNERHDLMVMLRFSSLFHSAVTLVDSLTCRLCVFLLLVYSVSFLIACFCLPFHFLRAGGCASWDGFCRTCSLFKHARARAYTCILALPFSTFLCSLLVRYGEWMKSRPGEEVSDACVRTVAHWTAVAELDARQEEEEEEEDEEKEGDHTLTPAGCGGLSTW